MSPEVAIDACTSPEGDIIQFKGETAWDAIISFHGLDIVEEDDFTSYLEANRTSPGRCDLKTLQAHYLEWRRLSQDC